MKLIVDRNNHTFNVLGYNVAYPEASLRCGESGLGTTLSSIQVKKNITFIHILTSQFKV